MIELICKSCQKKFKIYRYRAKSAKYCSNECRGLDFSTKYLGKNNPCYRGGKPKCECGNEMWYESKKCDDCSRKEDIRNWKGGIYVNNKKEYKSLKDKEWRKNNPDKKRFHSRTRSYRVRGSEGSHTLKEWEELKKTYHYMCLCCKRFEPEIKLTEDHIIPIVLGGTNYIWNIQPLCRSCNSIKKINIVDYRMEVVGLIN